MRSRVRRITREEMIKRPSQKNLLSRQVEQKYNIHIQDNITNLLNRKTHSYQITNQEVLEKIDHTVISYFSDFTENKYYERHAASLIGKLKEFGVNYLIENIQSKGSYMANCLMKPQFIHKKLLELQRPLIWMDCDTELRSPFSVFNESKEDLGMATHSGDINGIKASPLFFNYTKGAFLILKEWILHANLAQRKDIKELDHDAIKHWVIPSLGNKISLKIISHNYQDYCNGRYINNGNSNVPGKNDIHRSTMRLGDANRSQITSNALEIEVLIQTGNLEKDFELLENMVKKSANYCRIFFVLPDLEYTDSYIKYETITGGRISKIYERPNSIKLELSKEPEIRENWDFLILEKKEENKDLSELIKLITNEQA